MRDDADITLRPIEDADLDILFRHSLDDEARHMAAFTSKDPNDRAAFDTRWARLRSDPTVIARAIVSDGRVVGHLARFEMEGQVEVTYWIDRADWGRGLATAALRRFVRDVAERPLRARAAADNAASRRVLEKCGFRQIGEASGFAAARGETVPEAVYELPATPAPPI